MKKITPQTFLPVLFGMGLSLTQLQAQTVAPGDLILYFQKLGAQETVYVNLGKAATLFRGAKSGPSPAQQRVDFININATLQSAYGPGWASDSDIFAGLAGVFSNSANETVVDGDQHRTLYVSRPRNSVGIIGSSGSAQWNLEQQGNLTLASTNMLGLTNNFAVRLPSLSQGKIDTLALSVIDDQNPITPAGVQQTAFGQFPGGVQQRGTGSPIGTFGQAGQMVFALDLQRIVPNSAVISGKVDGPTRLGTFEGTVTVATDGDVSFLTTTVPFVDTDGDGLSDILEDALVAFGFDKNVFQPALVAQFMKDQGFFNEDSIQDLVTGGQVMIQAGATTVDLEIPIFKSEDLIDFDFAGNLELTLPKVESKEFYRIQLGE